MERSDEVLGIMLGWFESVKVGDPTWVDRHFSAGIRLVGTDPEEWFGYDDAARMLKGEAVSGGGQVQITMLQAEAFTEGTVAWGILHPSVTLPNGRVVAPRWSAVFHLEDGVWRAVQIHASLGVPNDQAFG